MKVRRCLHHQQQAELLRHHRLLPASLPLLARLSGPQETETGRITEAYGKSRARSVTSLEAKKSKAKSGFSWAAFWLGASRRSGRCAVSRPFCDRAHVFRWRPPEPSGNAKAEAKAKKAKAEPKASKAKAAKAAKAKRKAKARPLLSGPPRNSSRSQSRQSLLRAQPPHSKSSQLLLLGSSLLFSLLGAAPRGRGRPGVVGVCGAFSLGLCRSQSGEAAQGTKKAKAAAKKEPHLGPFWRR